MLDVLWREWIFFSWRGHEGLENIPSIGQENLLKYTGFLLFISLPRFMFVGHISHARHVQDRARYISYMTSIVLLTTLYSRWAVSGPRALADVGSVPRD